LPAIKVAGNFIKQNIMNIAVPLNTRVYRIAVSAFFFVAGLSFATWASRIPDIKEKLQLSDAGLGVVLFALPVGQILSLPIAAWLISKLGSRTVVIATALLYPLTLVLLAITAATWQLILALFLFGFWANSMNIAMNTQAVGVEKFYGRSIMASFHGLWSLAGFTGAVIGGFFVSIALSPLAHFSIVCLVTALLVLASYKYTLPDNDTKAGSQPLFTKPDKHILLLGLIAFCCMLCEGAMADWSGVYFQKVVEAPASFTTLGYVAFTATMAGGRFIGDWLVTRYSVKRMLQLSGITIAAGLMVAVAMPTLIAATTGFLLVGFGVSSVVPIVYGLAGKSSKMSASAALAAVSTISFLGFLIGPPVIGFIAELSSLRFSFALIALLGLGTTLLAAKVK
jgi:MFS family permease